MSHDYGQHPGEMVRRTDPGTAREAAERVNSAGWEQSVHEVIIARGLTGATIKEVTDSFGEEHLTTVGPRFAPLRRKGLIFNSGKVRGGRIVFMDHSLYGDWLLIAGQLALDRMALAERQQKTPSPLAREVERLRNKLISAGIDPDT